jgi:DNA-binding response OmpR family regulator
MIVQGLLEEGFRIGLDARRGHDLMARHSELDLAIVDIGLPDADGRDLVLSLRAQGSRLPVLLLTALAEVEHRLSGLRAGADDYLGKPFVFDELVLRARALVRRGHVDHSDAPLPDVTRLDHAAHAVRHAGRVQHLTPTEFRMLAVLLEHRGAVVRRASLRAAGWPYGELVHDNTLDAYVARLRARLRAVGSDVVIETRRGVGYRVAG